MRYVDIAVCGKCRFCRRAANSHNGTKKSEQTFHDLLLSRFFVHF